MQQILLVGAGTMGTTHMDAYRKMDHANVVGIVEKDADRAKALKFTEDYIYESIERAVQHHEIDIIDICVPTPYHTKVIKEASLYVDKIICEKPLARDLEEAQNILVFCQDNGIDLYVGHVVRFFKEYQKAREVICSGTIGNVGIVQMSRVGPFPNASYDWYSNFNYSGGVAMDLIIHDIDFLRWCFGEVKRVFAKGLRGRGYTGKDYVLVTLKFENGVIARIEGSWTHEKFHTSFEFAGDKGILEYDSREDRPLQVQGNVKGSGHMGVSVPEKSFQNSPYHDELVHFLECAKTGKKPLIGGRDALKAIEIATAANRSINTGKVISLQEEDFN